jgi:hypothetical protein
MSRGVNDVFQPYGQAMQRARWQPGLAASIQRRRLLQSMLRIEIGPRLDHPIRFGNPVNAGLHKLDGFQLTRWLYRPPPPLR